LDDHQPAIAASTCRQTRRVSVAGLQQLGLFVQQGCLSRGRGEQRRKEQLAADV
jgi:hypothetical protein